MLPGRGVAMRIYEVPDWSAVPQIPRVLAVGAFDGVHRGHQRLLGHVCRIAREYRVQSSIMTFEPIPAQIFRPTGRNNVRLSLAEERSRELCGQCIDTGIVVAFEQAFRDMSARQFASDLLVERLGVVALVASKSHRFGSNAEADIHSITALGMDLGFEVHVLPPIVEDGRLINSTQIRKRLWAGDVKTAADHLGRLYDVAGQVVGGRQLGRQLGFPTANLRPHPEKLVPADGVYACAARTEPSQGAPGRWMPAAVSIGNTPTIGDRGRTIEAHVLDRDDLELAGVQMRLLFCARVRDQQRFPSTDELVAQIRRDTERVREAYEEAQMKLSSWREAPCGPTV